MPRAKGFCEETNCTSQPLSCFHSEVEMANRAFKEAQNVDPSYVGGWLGQALLAEQGGYQEEAMDLFRHTAFLDHDLESSIGYGNWVCR